jgi:SAM-dependent methyltransferase
MYWRFKMTRTPSTGGTLNNTQWVKEQYRTPNNLNARIQLHRRFGTNPYPWLQWVFDRLQLAPGMQLLEIGCGPGGLWDENRQRLSPEVRLTLTDFSTGMISQARRTLGDLAQARFGVANAMELPFFNASFDVVVANHMLYHVPDRGKALAEIRRVLRPTGRFFAATNDHSHMHEVRELADAYMPGTSMVFANNERFPFDVATRELSQHFGQVQLHRFANNLVVTDANALADYMLSGVSFNLPEESVASFRAWLQERLQSQGAITITNATGLFEAATAPLVP